MNLLDQIGSKMEKTLVQAMLNEMVIAFEVYETKYCKEPTLKKEVIDLLVNYFTKKKLDLEEADKTATVDGSPIGSVDAESVSA